MAIKTSFVKRILNPYISSDRKFLELVEKLNSEYETYENMGFRWLDAPLEVEVCKDGPLSMTGTYNSEGWFFLGLRDCCSSEGFTIRKLGIDYDGVRLAGSFDSISTELFLPMETKRNKSVIEYDFGILENLKASVSNPFLYLTLRNSKEIEDNPFIYVPSKKGGIFGMELRWARRQFNV